MNEILNIIDKECINVYNKNAKRKSSDTRARMLFVDWDPTTSIIALRILFVKR